MVLNRVLVTGAAGMVGRHLVGALTNAGIEVLASGRSPSDDLPPKTKWIPWDLGDWLDADTLNGIFGEVDAIVHAGAAVPGNERKLTSKEYFDTNVRSCLNIGEWALDHDTPVVFISGAIVYAEIDKPDLKENSPTSRHGSGGFYGFTKLLAEHLFENLRARGLRVGILRPSSIYGEGLPYEKMIMKFLSAANRDGEIRLSPPTEDRIGMVHAADVARAALLLIQEKAWETFNISGGQTSSIEEIATACIHAVGKGKIEIKDEKPIRPATTRFDLDCSKASQLLGFSPELDLQDGLKLMWKQVTDGQSP